MIASLGFIRALTNEKDKIRVQNDVFVGNNKYRVKVQWIISKKFCVLQNHILNMVI